MAQTPIAIPELKLENMTASEETLIRCTGKITYTSAEPLRAMARGLIPETKRLVLDLAGISYVDSFGLGVLVSIYLSAKRQHCQLRLINLNQQAQQFLRVTNLTYLLGDGDFGR
jgi:anti-sigma B factor antagonist